jgi:hypothetical protein
VRFWQIFAEMLVCAKITASISGRKDQMIAAALKIKSFYKILNYFLENFRENGKS